MKSDLLAAVLVWMLAACGNSPQQVSTEDTTKVNTDTNTLSAQPPPPAKATLEFVYGIDISKYQGDEIDFISRKQDTLSFVICKATEGLTMLDPDFKNNWKTIDEKDFIRGAYHFYHCADDPVKQAAHFLSAVDSFERADFPPIVDFEETSIDAGCAPAQVQKNLLVFLKQLEQKTGRKPVIYTDNNMGSKYLNNAAFLDYPLFIADYSNSRLPALPGAWKGKQWALWQKSEHYELSSTTDDFDIFNGGPGELQVFISKH